MKRLFSLVFLIVLSFMIISCNNKTNSTATTENIQNETLDTSITETKPVSLSIATGGTSGTYYGFTNIIAQTMNEKHSDKLNLTVESTGASKANIQLIDDEENDIALVQNDVITYAYTATDMFEGENPIKSFSVIASCYPEAIQIISNKNITSIADLKGKRVSVGDAGSMIEFNAKQILEIYGIDINTDINKNNQSFADSCDSIKNGLLDAAFVTAGAPTTAVTELATTYDFNILSLDEEHLNSLMDKYQYYTKEIISAGTYNCINEDITTVAVMATYITNNKTSEDTIYTFTKSLFEDKNDFQHQKAELLDINRGISGISIPFHKVACKILCRNGHICR